MPLRPYGTQHHTTCKRTSISNPPDRLGIFHSQCDALMHGWPFSAPADTKSRYILGFALRPHPISHTRILNPPNPPSPLSLPGDRPAGPPATHTCASFRALLAFTTRSKSKSAIGVICGRGQTSQLKVRVSRTASSTAAIFFLGWPL